MRAKRRFWTPDEERVLRESYETVPAAELAACFTCAVERVYAKAKKLGVKLSEPERLRRASLAGSIGTRHPNAVAHRLPKGNVPPNKGLRRPGYSIGRGRMQTTQFKKGQTPSNTCPVGAIVPNADGYLRMKVADLPESVAGHGALCRNWIFLHVYVWEKAHGPIPRGHRIWWKDRDHNNCALENLELLSDREHMARTTIHNVLPPDVKAAVMALGALKRKLRREDDTARELRVGRGPEPGK